MFSVARLILHFYIPFFEKVLLRCQMLVAIQMGVCYNKYNKDQRCYMAEDILFQQRDFIFSYRVGALLYRDGKILMQRSLGDGGYALPGGQVAFGEFSQKALARELMEETGAAIKIGRLCAVAEVFFQWQKPCHQINLYYLAIAIKSSPPSTMFFKVAYSPSILATI